MNDLSAIQQLDTGEASLTVDLAAIAANWRHLAKLAAGAECAGVVKADAYGLGVEPVAKTLLAAGCHTFFVAHLAEGVKLRKIAPEARIFVLNGLPPRTSRKFVESELLPVLGSLPEIQEWFAFCRANGQKFPAAIHIDTGMNRLGLGKGDILRARTLMEGFSPVLVMSHFVSAEDVSAPRNRRQIDAFAQARGQLPPMPASLCNSAGIFLEDAPFLDLVRPGYALYGGNPTPGNDNPMQSVVTLTANILQVREVGPGETIGYNARWTAPSWRRLATIGLGYADGFPRSASCGPLGADVFVGGHFCPIVGRISMDLSIIDITETGPLHRGDKVEVLGPHISICDLGVQAGTIGYEVLTSLGRRYNRTYLNDAS